MNRRQHMTEKGGVVTDYDYDGISRLTDAVTKMNGTTLRHFAYSYDRHTNMASAVTSGGTPGLNTSTRYFGYGANEELCWTSGSTGTGCSGAPTGATTYTSDGTGAEDTNTGGLDIDYNAIGQTSSIDPAGTAGATTMSYTGVTQDHWITKADSGSNTSMSYGFNDITSQTTTGSGGGTDWYVRDPKGSLLALVDAATSGANATRYFLNDAQDSVIATMDTTRTTVRYLYEPFGQQIRSWIDATPTANTTSGTTPPDGSETGTSTSVSGDRNPWRYNSGYLDPATGMLKFGTRYYQPDLFRWTQIDPKAGQPSSPTSLNPYAFVAGNPVNRSDVSGRSWLENLGLVTDGFQIGLAVAEHQYGDALALTLGAAAGTLVGGLCGVAATALIETGPGVIAAEAGCFAVGNAVSSGVAETNKDNYEGFNQ